MNSRFSDKIYITFDVEWANDDVLNDTIDIMEENNISATFFATHQTKALDRIRNNSSLELGIHPNFNKALLCQESKPYSQVIEDALDIVPEAISYRSHCLTQNALISLEAARCGIRYDLNVYIPLEAKLSLKPFYAPSGLITVPFFFEDDIYFFMSEKKKPVAEHFETDELKVFNFHPSHIFLNANTNEQYDEYKKNIHDTEKLKEIVTHGYGARDFLNDVISYGKKNNYKFHKIRDIQLATTP